MTQVESVIREQDKESAAQGNKTLTMNPIAAGVFGVMGVLALGLLVAVLMEMIIGKKKAFSSDTEQGNQ